MRSKIKICYELLEIIDRQEDMIAKQNEMIARLTNENFEKGNMLDALMQQGICEEWEPQGSFLITQEVVKWIML